MFRRTRASVGWLTASAMLGVVGLSSGSSSAESVEKESLVVRASNLKNNRGKVMARLFRRGDRVPKGPGFRETKARIESGEARLEFSDLPYGQYALFLFHDENDNGTVDHNFLGLPSEALGFSANFRVTLFSGLPDFDDLRFSFSEKSRALVIPLHNVP